MYRIEDISTTITGERKAKGGYLMDNEMLLQFLEQMAQAGWKLVGFCGSNRAIFRQAPLSRYVLVGEDLEEAREHYFASGMPESDIGARSDPTWYWRRAAKAWREKFESMQAKQWVSVPEPTPEELGKLFPEE